jgi:hypothetical protein
MKIYILMGTHLAEISQCINNLVKSAKDLGEVEIHHPDEYEWESASQDKVSLQPYDPETVLWVFDPDRPATAFIVVDPKTDLIGQLEHLADNFGKCQIEPLKVVTCVDCERTEQSAKLRAWYEACIYYSDVVLLGNRQNAGKSFVREYQKHFERLCYPCLFLLLKGTGNPTQPGEILTSGPRRISQMFDLPESTPDEPLPGMVIEASCDLDMEEFEIDPFRTPADEESAAHIPDPTEFVVVVGRKS